MTEDEPENESEQDAPPEPEFMDEPPLVAEDPDMVTGTRGTRDALAVDYAAVELPTGTYDEATVEQRRAVLLNRIEQAGHPGALPSSYRELADEFDVSKATIARDMKLLSEWCAENVERDHVSIMDAVFRGAVLDLVRDGKKAWAAEVGREWFEWLADMGAIERVPQNVNLDHTLREASDETDEYEIVEDDDALALDAPDAGRPECAECGEPLTGRWALESMDSDEPEPCPACGENPLVGDA